MGPRAPHAEPPWLQAEHQASSPHPRRELWHEREGRATPCTVCGGSTLKSAQSVRVRVLVLSTKLQLLRRTPVRFFSASPGDERMASTAATISCSQERIEGLTTDFSVALQVQT